MSTTRVRRTCIPSWYLYCTDDYGAGEIYEERPAGIGFPGAG